MLLMFVAFRSQRQYEQPSVALVRTSSSTGARPCAHTNFPEQRGVPHNGCQRDSDCCEHGFPAPEGTNPMGKGAVCVFLTLGFGDVGVCVIPDECREGRGPPNFQHLAMCDMVEHWRPASAPFPDFRKKCCDGTCLKADPIPAATQWEQAIEVPTICGPVCIEGTTCDPRHTESAECGDGEQKRKACCNKYQSESEWKLNKLECKAAELPKHKCVVDPTRMNPNFGPVDPNLQDCGCPVRDGLCRWPPAGPNCRHEVKQYGGSLPNFWFQNTWKFDCGCDTEDTELLEVYQKAGNC